MEGRARCVYLGGDRSGLAPPLTPRTRPLALRAPTRLRAAAAFRRHVRREVIAARTELACCYVYHEPAPRGGASLTRLVVTMAMSLTISIPLAFLITCALPALASAVGLTALLFPEDGAAAVRRRAREQQQQRGGGAARGAQASGWGGDDGWGAGGAAGGGLVARAQFFARNLLQRVGRTLGGRRGDRELPM